MIEKLNSARLSVDILNLKTLIDLSVVDNANVYNIYFFYLMFHVFIQTSFRDLQQKYLLDFKFLLTFPVSVVFYVNWGFVITSVTCCYFATRDFSMKKLVRLCKFYHYNTHIARFG